MVVGSVDGNPVAWTRYAFLSVDRSQFHAPWSRKCHRQCNGETRENVGAKRKAGGPTQCFVLSTVRCRDQATAVRCVVRACVKVTPPVSFRAAALRVADGAGLSVIEVMALKVSAVASKRMLMCVKQVKGGTDRHARAPGVGGRATDRASRTAPRELQCRHVTRRQRVNAGGLRAPWFVRRIA